MLFAVIAFDKQDGLATRMANRSAHFEWAQASARVKIGGPFLNEKDEMVGSLIIFEAADLASRQGVARRGSLCEGGVVRVQRGAALEAHLQSGWGRYLMAYWLFKSEPETWSWEQQKAKGAKGEPWSGVRNHQAKLNMMKMKKGERGFFYHSGKERRSSASWK